MSNQQERVYNFSAGPSMLPLDVMQDIASQLTNYEGSGQSVMEMIIVVLEGFQNKERLIRTLNRSVLGWLVLEK